MAGTAANWQKWYEQGITPIPIKLGTKNEPLIKWKRWQTERPARALVERWFANGEHNVGLLMGQTSGGLICLDHDSIPVWARWRRDHRDLQTLSVVTPRPGRHDYFRLNKVLTTMYLDGLDLKASGYTLAPNSLHPSGGRYEGNGKPILTIDSLEQVLDLTANDTQYLREGSASNIETDNAGTLPNTHTECSRQIANRQDLIGSIKRALPVLALITHHTEFVVPSSRDGRWYIARCPFHRPDRHPSFWVDNARGICSCFKPECKARQPGGKAMDVINLYSRLHRIGNNAAIRALAQEVGL